MPQPERDHRAVHAVVKKVHGCGVATDMRGDPLPFKRGTCLHGNTGVLGEETLDRIAAQSTAPALVSSVSWIYCQVREDRRIMPNAIRK